jgi:hypothetical protein
MLHRYRAAVVAAVAVAAALAVTSGAALAAKGQFSIGGNFGTSITNGGAFNDSLKAAIGSQYKEISGDWEYGGSLRYGLSNKVSLDVEVNKIKAKSNTPDSPNPDLIASETAVVVPVNLIIGLTQNDSYGFNFVAGVGPMLSAQWKAEQGTTEIHSNKKTGLYAQGGFEGMYNVSSQFAITARVLGRLAKASDLELSTDPTFKADANMSGVAFSLGLRAFFGGSK